MLSYLQTSLGTVSYRLERSERRHLLIRIEEDGNVRVFVPFHCPDADVEKFLQKKAGWILRKSNEQKNIFNRVSGKKFAHGQDFLFLGRKYPLNILNAEGKRGAIEFDGGQWKVFLPEQAGGAKPLLVNWYRKQAEELLATRIFHYSRIMGVAPDTIKVRTQKRLWGSCDHRTKAINLNWQLIMSPLSVIDYVVVHELCHLKISDHSKHFWKEVAKVIPDYEVKHRWLKENAWDMALPEEEEIKEFRD